MAGMHGIAGLEKIETIPIGQCELAGQQRMLHTVVFHLERRRSSVVSRQFYDVSKEQGMLLAPPGDVKSALKLIRKNFPEGFDVLVLLQQSEFQKWQKDIPDMEMYVISRRSRKIPKAKYLKERVTCSKGIGYVLTSFP